MNLFRLFSRGQSGPAARERLQVLLAHERAAAGGDADLLGKLRDEGRVMLVSTHNLGSVPDFCDRTVFVKGTVIASGPTAETFTEANLERAFGGVLRHFTLGGDALHDDDDARAITIFTDDERPLVHYGEHLQRREDRANEDRANEDRK